MTEPGGRSCRSIDPRNIDANQLRQLLYWHGPLITTENNNHAIVLCYSNGTRVGAFDPNQETRAGFYDNLFQLEYSILKNILLNTCLVYLPAPGAGGLGQCMSCTL